MAQPGCYGCLGTGTLQGFGAKPGTTCSCCTCSCGEPAEPNDDGERVECRACRRDREERAAAADSDQRWQVKAYIEEAK